MSPEEAELFARVRTWLELGASLSVACMNAQVSESQFAALVAELEQGRNSEFAATLSELLRTPWHFGIGQKDTPAKAIPHEEIPKMSQAEFTARWRKSFDTAFGEIMNARIVQFPKKDGFQ